MNKPSPRTALKATGMRRRYARCLETELAAESAIVSRIWTQLGSPTYEQLKGRSIYDLIDELKAELATEREKVRVLHKALKNIKNSICRIVPDGYSQPCVDESADECDRIIEAAMKEGAKWPTPEQYEDAAKRVTEMAAHIRAQTKKGGRK